MGLKNIIMDAEICKKEKSENFNWIYPLKSIKNLVDYRKDNVF